MNQKTKFCNKCSTEKSVLEFHKKSASKDGFQSMCKECLLKLNRDRVVVVKKTGPTIIKNYKECNQCHNIKPISQFFIRRSTASGFGPYCKPCWSEKTIAAKRRGMKK